MKSFIKTSLIMMAIASLVGCGEVTKETKYHPYSINQVVLSPLPDESGVSKDEFDKVANTIAKNNSNYECEFYFQCHETLVGSYVYAMDRDGNPLPDGADLYGAASLTFENKNKSYGLLEEKNISNLPTMMMHNTCNFILPTYLDDWFVLFDSYSSYEGYEMKFFLSPLRTYVRYNTTKMSGVDGSYNRLVEWDVTFREDGFMKTCVYKWTVEVDAMVTVTKDYRSEPPVYNKGTHVLVNKLEASYTFKEQ